MNLKQELKNLINIVKALDRKVVTIFLSVAVLQTISYYITSRRFFRVNFFPGLQSNQDVFLIEYIYWFIGDFFTFFILAILIIKLYLKESIKDYGFNWGEHKIGFTVSTIFILAMLPVIWFFSSTPEFVEKYPHLLSARANWGEFSIYETGMLIYMFSWEFIWRGFMLFGLKEKFGYYAVLIQMIPFVITHAGKPFLEILGAIPGGIFLGLLALRTRSIFYGVIIHFFVMLFIDLLSILRLKADDFGLGLDSLINIFSHLF